MTDAVQIVDAVQALDLPPGATLVLMAERSISMEQAERLKGYLVGRFPGHEVLVLSDGLKVGVINPTANDRLERIEQNLQLLAANVLRLADALSDDQEEHPDDTINRDLEGIIHGGERPAGLSLDGDG